MTDEGRERRKRRRKGGGLRVPSDNVPRRSASTTSPPPGSTTGSEDAPSTGASAQQAAVALSMSDSERGSAAPLAKHAPASEGADGLERASQAANGKAGATDGVPKRISSGWSDGYESTTVDPEPGASEPGAPGRLARSASRHDDSLSEEVDLGEDEEPTEVSLVGRGGVSTDEVTAIRDGAERASAAGSADDELDGNELDGNELDGNEFEDDGDPLRGGKTQQIPAFTDEAMDSGVGAAPAYSDGLSSPSGIGDAGAGRTRPRASSVPPLLGPTSGKLNAVSSRPTAAVDGAAGSAAESPVDDDWAVDSSESASNPSSEAAQADTNRDSAAGASPAASETKPAASVDVGQESSVQGAGPSESESAAGDSTGKVAAPADDAESGEVLTEEFLEEVDSLALAEAASEFDDEPETQPGERARAAAAARKPNERRAETVVEAVEELSPEEIVELGQGGAKPPPKPPPAPPAKPKASPAPPQARKRKGKPWFEEIFDEDYLRTLPFLTPQATQAESLFVLESLGIDPGAQVLDVGCGYGRHAMELAARGMHVVGLDLSLPLLIRGADEAQRRGLNINFVHGDMRELSFDAQFDGAYCLFGTFGFFDDETNKKAAQNIARALKPGGRFVIDVLNRDYLVADLPSRVWWEGDGCVVLEEVEFNYFSSRIVSSRSVVFDDGRQLEQEISMRAYSLHELGKLLHAAGFRILEVSGSIETRGRFFGSHSRSLLVVCERRPPKDSD